MMVCCFEKSIIYIFTVFHRLHWCQSSLAVAYFDLDAFYFSSSVITADSRKIQHQEEADMIAICAAHSQQSNFVGCSVPVKVTGFKAHFCKEVADYF
jgi:hypothetical protein